MYRILGLDDDCHSPCFMSETGVGFHNVRERVEYLCEPHIEPVKVKMFAIVDEMSSELEAFGEEKIDMMFDALSGGFNIPDFISFEDCFEIFWDSANRWWW